MSDRKDTVEGEWTVDSTHSRTVTVRILLKVSDRKDTVEGEWTAHTFAR